MADGHIVYQGPAEYSAEYFGMLNAEAGRKYSNPPDYFMKILSINYPKTIDDDARIRRFVSRYEKEC